MDGKDRLVRPDEIARRLGIGRRTVVRWMREERLPHVDLGKVKLVREADFEAFVAAHRRAGRI